MFFSCSSCWRFAVECGNFAQICLSLIEVNSGYSCSAHRFAWLVSLLTGSLLHAFAFLFTLIRCKQLGLQLVRVINCLGKACKLSMFHLEIFVLLTELVCEVVLPAFLCAGKILSLQKIPSGGAKPISRWRRNRKRWNCKKL
jgi:hypothetical protein